MASLGRLRARCDECWEAQTVPHANVACRRCGERARREAGDRRSRAELEHDRLARIHRLGDRQGLRILALLAATKCGTLAALARLLSGNAPGMRKGYHPRFIGTELERWAMGERTRSFAKAFRLYAYARGRGCTGPQIYAAYNFLPSRLETERRQYRRVRGRVRPRGRPIKGEAVRRRDHKKWRASRSSV